METAHFTLDVHHGGLFSQIPKRKYNSGRVDKVYDVDPDRFGFFDLQQEVRDMGYQIGKFDMYYRVPGKSFDTGLVQIVGRDWEVMEMLRSHKGFSVIEIFVEANTDSLDPLVEPERGAGEVVELEDEDDSEDKEYEITEGLVESDDSEYSHEYPDWLKERIHTQDEDNIFAHLEEEPQQLNASELLNDDSGNANELLNDDSGWYSDTEPNLDAILEGDEGGGGGSRPPKCPDFNEDVDMGVELKVGMQFRNAQVFRTALIEWQVKQGYDLAFENNDNTRITAHCKQGCGFRIHASPMQREKTFQIKSLRPVHSCGRTFNNHLVNSKYLANKYLWKLKDSPNYAVESMQKDIHRELQVNVSRTQAYRAKRKAKEIIEGDLRTQFARVRDYCQTVMLLNPNSCLTVTPAENRNKEGEQMFQRMYVRLGAQKEGFLAGCRPIIGLDGCFLKGLYGGQLLSAIGCDGNDNMFPVAVAVVEAETKNSWGWFMEKLIDDIGSVEANKWTFISDRQKGLVQVFKELIPGADHRYCWRHMWTNFNKQWKGKEYHDLMWNIASAGTISEFDKHMKKLKDMDPEGRPDQWLLREPPETWARSHFSPRSKCDMLVNNLNESWNRAILPARGLPIVELIEWIRRKLMHRFQIKRLGMEKYDGPIVPTVVKTLEVNKVTARHAFAFFAGDGKFECDYFNKRYVVDLNGRTCGCRHWDLTGIPCKHAISCIYMAKLRPEDFVHEYYSKETYLKAYSSMIHPVPGEHDWVDSGCEPLAPPPYRKPAGRPRKERIKGAHEVENPYQVSRAGKVYTCGRCLQPGHNSKSCKGPVHENSRLFKKQRKDAEVANNQGVQKTVKGGSASNAAPSTAKKRLTKAEARALRESRSGSGTIIGDVLCTGPTQANTRRKWSSKSSTQPTKGSKLPRSTKIIANQKRSNFWGRGASSQPQNTMCTGGIGRGAGSRGGGIGRGAVSGGATQWSGASSQPHNTMGTSGIVKGAGSGIGRDAISGGATQGRGRGATFWFGGRMGQSSSQP